MELKELQNTILLGDSLEEIKKIPDECVDCVVTSPPYYALRDYGTGDKQIGLEKTPEQYIGKLVELFREIRRVLKKEGTVWLNIGDSYWGGAGVMRPFHLRVARYRKAVSALTAVIAFPPVRENLRI